MSRVRVSVLRAGNSPGCPFLKVIGRLRQQPLGERRFGPAVALPGGRPQLRHQAGIIFVTLHGANSRPCGFPCQSESLLIVRLLAADGTIVTGKLLRPRSRSYRRLPELSCAFQRYVNRQPFLVTENNPKSDISRRMLHALFRAAVITGVGAQVARRQRSLRAPHERSLKAGQKRNAVRLYYGDQCGALTPKMAGMSENRNRLGVKAAIPPDVRARLDALAGGDANATARFIEHIAPIVWAACSVLTSGDPEARPAFREVIQSLGAENFALVRTYDGRCRFEDFLALKVRDVLGERVLRLLRADKERGWRAMEGFFRADLLRLIQRRLPSGHYADARQDAYQAISLALVEGDCRRLNSYDGRGSFTAFVLRMADRILIDHLRSANTRRRQTEAFVQAVALDGEEIEASPEARRLLAA